MYDVVALGELLIDFTVDKINSAGYPVMVANPGGAPANYLAALAKYGISTGFIGKVGNDYFGKKLKATLEENGIGTSGLCVDDSFFTTLAFVTLDETGDREFSFSRKPGADTCLCDDELKYDEIAQAKVFHFGTLSLTDEPSRGATHRAVKIAKENGAIISFDPNYRPPLWRSIDEAKEAMFWGLSVSDVVKISDNEVDFLLGVSPEEGLQILLENWNTRLVYITCGADGCLWGTHSVKGRTEALKGITPIDTTGAGDIFGGSAMYAFLTLGKKIEELTETDLRSITRFATVSAGLSTLSPGGINSIVDFNTIMERINWQ